MRYLFLICSLLFITPASAADETHTVIRPAGDAVAEDFLWTARPLIIFADSALDPKFIEQINLLTTGVEDLIERDVVVLTDTDPAAASALRTTFRPRGFMLVLIGKDGTIRLRKPFPWDIREISRAIDKTELRQQEIRDRRATE